MRRGIIGVAKDSWVLFLALSVVNASNYLFHVIISRLLGPSAYGALGSVLAILLVVSVPLGAVQATMAKRLAEMRGDHEERITAAWINIVRSMAKPIVLIAALLALASPLLKAFLHLNSEVAAVLVALYVLPAALGAVVRGVLQGLLRFKALAAVSILPVIVRVVVGVAFVRAGGGVTGAIAATVAGESAGVALALAFLAQGGSLSGATVSETKWFFREARPIAAGMIAMWVLIELDVLLARHFLVPNDAGSYAAAGLLARAVLFIPGAVGLVALPHFAESRGRGDEAYQWLLNSAAFVLVLGFGAAGVLAGARRSVVGLTFGQHFLSAAGLLPVLCLAMLALGLVNLFVFFHVAAGSRAFHLLWIAIGAEVAGISLFHTSGEEIALVLVVIAVVVAFGGFLTCRAIAISPAPLGKLPRDLSVLHKPVGLLDMRTPEISVVIPCHNGGTTLSTNVCSTRDVLHSLNRPYEVIVVSDGSTDGCERAIVDAGVPVTVVRYAHQQGKGMALRVGMTGARGKYVAFMDSDGDLDAAELRSFLAVMELYEPELVIGSKRHPLSAVDYPMTRRVMSWVYQRVVRLLFGLNVRDTQTGMKLIRRDVLDQVLPRMLEKRFAFDLEFLVVARRLGFRRIFEAPIRLRYQFSSTVSPRAAFRILLDTAAIFYRDHILRTYDQPPAAVALPEWQESVLHAPLVPALD
ncbi:MAG: glycosyltransferase [Actinomycetota bacterium]|nr:glycosyltransferase [Actinomycetota bacterium]